MEPEDVSPVYEGESWRLSLEQGDHLMGDKKRTCFESIVIRDYGSATWSYELDRK